MQRRVPQLLRQLDSRNSICEKYFGVLKSSEHVPGYMFQHTRCSFEESLSAQASMPPPATNQKMTDLKYLLQSSKEAITKVGLRVDRLNGFYETSQRNIEVIAKNQIALYTQSK
ncbi:Hypothetical_protein [Hexamita inflata]|uniref:Hypothetical_protein n=1 Tax=Hexamita inflata TaxID=28002 RepID=A0AA86QAN8_9EUKA|nr:Hypothetical protein HINF_LOCUS42133 [Hexamita inflata]